MTSASREKTYDSSHMRTQTSKIGETVENAGCGGLRAENGEFVLPEDHVSLWEDGEVPELSSDDGRTPVWMDLTPPNCALKNN